MTIRDKVTAFGYLEENYHFNELLVCHFPVHPFNALLHSGFNHNT